MMTSDRTNPPGNEPPEVMASKMLTGGCRCGAVRFELSMEQIPPVYCCHCLDCQKWSGSAFTEQGVIREGDLKISGPLVETSVTSRQGGTSLQYVCDVCHNRIHSKNPTRPGIALLRAGTLDDAPTIEPRVHVWVKRKQPWVVLPDNVPVFQEGASSEEMKSALG
jgi:Uncharacterized conserved protein